MSFPNPNPNPSPNPKPKTQNPNPNPNPNPKPKPKPNPNPNRNPKPNPKPKTPTLTLALTLTLTLALTLTLTLNPTQHDKEVLASLSPWHQGHFRSVEEGGNGLFVDVEKSEHTLEMVTSELIAFLEQHITKGESRLGGFSIQCDIEVLRRRMPAVLPYFNHQIIDVSTILQLGRRWNMGRRTRHEQRHEKTRQDKPIQAETRQDKPSQDKPRQDKTS